MSSLTKRFLIFALTMGLVAGAGWLGRKAYKNLAEGKLVRQAEEYVQQKDWRNAGLCLQRALQINPNGTKPSKMMADLAEATGAPSALNWRIRVAQLAPESAEYRFDWARTALRHRDLQATSDALSGVDSKAKATAAYHKLMGGFESTSGRPEEAEKHYREALRLEPTNQITALNLVTLHLASTNGAAAAAARAALQRMATNAELKLVALERLKTDAVFRKVLPEALAYSTALIQDPRATFDSRLDHVHLLRKSKDSGYSPYLASLKQEGMRSPTTAYALGRWLTITEGPTNALAWLHSLPAEVRTNDPVPLALVDGLILTKDWRTLLALVEDEDWKQAEFYRLAVASLAQRSLGQKLAAESSWRKAFRLSARRLDQLTRLLQVAERANWKAEELQVLQEITDKFTKERWAVDRLTLRLYAAGDTRGIHALLAKMQASAPADALLKNNLAYVRLLLKTELETAHRLAREAYEAMPTDGSVISTYAYSLLLQDKPTEALSVFKHVKPDALKNPTVAACFGVVSAKAGNKAVAREHLTLAEATPMLPEEKEIVRQARASL